MKKTIFSLAVTGFLTAFSLFTTPQVHAQDVWAYSAHDNWDNYEAYVVTDSIQWNKNYTVLTCAVKNVDPSGHVKTVFWTFDRLSGEWRYKTSYMHGHTNRVTNGSWSDEVLKVCMNNG